MYQGIFHFSAGIRCTPLIVEVFERKDVEAELNDQGFAPKIIRVDESSGVIWRWSGCSLPHTVTEARYSHKRGAMVQRENAEKYENIFFLFSFHSLYFLKPASYRKPSKLRSVTPWLASSPLS